MPRRRVDLQRQAKKFAGEVSTLLNCTVTNGPRLSVVMNPHANAVIGYKIGKNDLLGDPIPLTTSGSQAPIHLDFLHTLDLDDSGEFLTTSRSTYTLRADDASTPIITYDFVREPPNPYPEAHIHLHGQSDALQRMLDSCGLEDRKPADLHIPVEGAGSDRVSRTSSSSASSKNS